jgi:Arginine-tRNA-protein transferase, C terminus
MSVHGDDESDVVKERYINFLCNSSLQSSSSSNDPDSYYGAFHQHYLLDGKLIAVGVIDILPRCLSSVYFFYDPAYEFLSLGVVSALKEIDWVQQQLTAHPSLKYYYMGYYIHTCPKMKYKAAYAPSELLCDVSFTWHPITKSLLSALDHHRYVVFSAAAAAAADCSGTTATTADIKVQSFRRELSSKLAPSMLCALTRQQNQIVPLSALTPASVAHLQSHFTDLAYHFGDAALAKRVIVYL